MTDVLPENNAEVLNVRTPEQPLLGYGEPRPTDQGNIAAKRGQARVTNGIGSAPYQDCQLHC